MKRQLTKKLTSIVLAAAMVLSVFGVFGASVFAEASLGHFLQQEDPIDGIDTYESTSDFDLKSSESTEREQKYTYTSSATDTDAYKIVLKWHTPTFEFTEAASNRIWIPETLSWQNDEGNPSGATMHQGTSYVKVFNNSSQKIHYKYEFVFDTGINEDHFDEVKYLATNDVDGEPTSEGFAVTPNDDLESVLDAYKDAGSPPEFDQWKIDNGYGEYGPGVKLFATINIKDGNFNTYKTENGVTGTLGKYRIVFSEPTV